MLFIIASFDEPCIRENRHKFIRFHIQSSYCTTGPADLFKEKLCYAKRYIMYIDESATIMYYKITRYNVGTRTKTYMKSS